MFGFYPLRCKKKISKVCRQGDSHSADGRRHVRGKIRPRCILSQSLPCFLPINFRNGHIPRKATIKSVSNFYFFGGGGGGGVFFFLSFFLLVLIKDIKVFFRGAK